MCSKEGDKNPRDKIEDFLLKFVEREVEILSEYEIEEREQRRRKEAAERSKAYMFALLGFDPRKKDDPKTQEKIKGKQLPEKVLKAMAERKKRKG